MHKCFGRAIKGILSECTSPYLLRYKHTAVLLQNLKQSQSNRKVIPLDGDEKQDDSKDSHEEVIDLVKVGRQGRQKGLNIIKLAQDDGLFSKILLKVKSKKTRAKSGLIMLEGKRLIQDALAVGVLPEMIFFSRKKDLEELNLPHDEIKLFRTPYKEIQLWSDLITSPGILAICKIPPPVPEPKESFPVTVVCDQVREPGNLGAIIRNCAAAGVSKVVLSPGCTDLWDTKVLRAGTGAHFRLPIYLSETWDMRDLLPKNTTVFVADNSTSRDCIEKDKYGNNNNVPLIPYYSVNYNDHKHIAIVIGGETEGLSNDAFQLVHELGGARVNIPLSNNVDSLNSGAALSVILFEIKRQRLISS